MIKRILLIAFGILLVAQLIQPDHAVPAIDPANDMLAVTNAPEEIRQLVIGACYDCHSYQTTYPWYSRITPVNFIMQQHINEGREVLNYSVWDKYANSEAAMESGEEIQEGEMPPGYYRFMHRHGDLSPAQQQQLIAWFAALPASEGGALEPGGTASGEEENDED